MEPKDRSLKIKQLTLECLHSSGKELQEIKIKLKKLHDQRGKITK